MAFTAIAIAGVAISAASTGYEINASRQASADAKDTQHKQEAAVRQQNAALAERQTQADATAAARMARARQAAFAGSSTGYDQTIGTTPLGLSGGATSGGNNTGGKVTLGQ